MKYIAYGSNMVQEQMAFRCPNARLIGTSWLLNHRLEFFLHATVEKTRSKGARVPVAVWEIDEADERSLDRYEGVPNYYVKRQARAQMRDGSEIEGLIYIMKAIRPYPPTKEYYNGIFHAYNRMGFGSEIETVLEPALQRTFRRGIKSRFHLDGSCHHAASERGAAFCVVAASESSGALTRGWRWRRHVGQTWGRQRNKKSAPLLGRLQIKVGSFYLPTVVADI